MKKLQNNYTTIEQSKRLLELGLPSDSADLFYHKGGKWVSIFQMEDKTSDFPARFERTPCWSVGRLIEIIKKCNHPDDVDQVFCELAYSKNNLVELIVRLMEENKEITDFSKLEE